MSNSTLDLQGWMNRYDDLIIPHDCFGGRLLSKKLIDSQLN